MQETFREDGVVAEFSASTVTPLNRKTAIAGNWLGSGDGFAKALSFHEDAGFYAATPEGLILFAGPAFNSLSNLPQGTTHIPAAIVQFITANRESYVRDENHSNGSGPRHVRAFHYPVFDRDGALSGIFGHYTDTSDNTAAFALISQDLARKHDRVRASSDFFWECDAQGLLIDLSDRVTDILGKPAVMFLGRPMTEAGQFSLRSGAPCPPPPEFAKHQPFRDVIFLLTNSAGEKRYFLLGAVPVFEPVSGKFAGFRGVGADVTARFRAEDAAAQTLAELQQAQEALNNRNAQLQIERGRAEAALKAKSEFLATMSHELRTPLNAILGFSETMTMKLFGELNSQYTGYAGDILRSGQHLLSLIDAMLEAASLENNEVALHPKSVPLAELISKAVSIVLIRAEAKNITTRRASAPEGWLINADPVASTQIFVNLLSNAVKFTRPGGNIGVDVEARINSNGRFAAITVWDDGIGVPEEMQEKIFAKFVRGADAYTYDDAGQGLGIGLNISRRLSELMGGNLTLQSTPGKGSRFTVELPLLRAD